MANRQRAARSRSLVSRSRRTPLLVSCTAWHAPLPRYTPPSRHASAYLPLGRAARGGPSTQASPYCLQPDACGARFTDLPAVRVVAALDPQDSYPGSAGRTDAEGKAAMGHPVHHHKPGIHLGVEAIRAQRDRPQEMSGAGVQHAQGLVGLVQGPEVARPPVQCQGQTEGKETKIKTTRRTVLGRARFDLLRPLILHAV